MRKRSRYNSVRPIIAEASDLLLKCAGYLDDRYASETEDEYHFDTYYAIDNDVIALYLAPDELNTDYLAVFGEGPDSITTRLLAFLLGDFLFQSTEPLLHGHEKQKCRFLIIPPHDEELIRMLTAIHRNLSSVTDHVKPDTFQKLSDIFVDFEETHDDKTLLNKLRQHVPELVELFNPYKGPKSALSRFALLPDTVFQRIDTYDEDGFTFPLLDSVGDREDRILDDKLIARWRGYLMKSVPRKKPDYAIRGDAKVLATIEHVNSNLFNSRKQVVLITGSNHLFEAANNYRPWGDEKPSFAEKYLRHPQAFLSHPKFFFLSDIDAETSNSADDMKMPFQLIDWLTLFFPSVLRSAIQLQATVFRKFLRTLKDTEDRGFTNKVFNAMSNTGKDENPKSLINGWKEQVASVADMRYSGGLNFAEERGAVALAQKLIELRNNSAWSIEKLRGIIIKESIISISSLYAKTALLIGLWSQTARKAPKGIPALRFDGEYQVIEKYCSELVKILLDNIGKPISKKQLEELHLLNEEVEQIDPSLYHSHIVHSLAFMAKGHWNASLTLAKTALSISDSIESSVRGFLRGREAAYLACIAARRSVSNRSGLEIAYKYLDESLKRENEGCPEDIRFTAERLMLDARSYYFELFCESKILDIVTLTDTINKLYSLFNTVKNEKDERVRLWVQRQVLTHFFTLLLIVRDVQRIDNVIINFDINSCLLYYQDLLEKSDIHYHKPEDDPYAYLIYSISTAIWVPDPDKRTRKRDEAIKTLKKLKPFSPYDKKRLELLYRCICSL